MTVSYSLRVANGTAGAFFKLLLCWKGSIYKCIWVEVLIFLGFYFIFSVIYRNVLNPEQRIIFESLSLYCERYTGFIPITFMLGFYVSLIVGRWWEAFWKLPWPDRIISMFSSYCNGKDEYSTNMRKTFLRYIIASQVLALSTISVPVKKRFPTMAHVKDAGLLTDTEIELLHQKGLEGKSWTAVCFWCCSLVNELRDEPNPQMKKPFTDFYYRAMLEEINNYKATIGALTCYDWISIPLQYTQVVTIAVYSFFAACVLGRQFLTPANEPPPSMDLYFPFFTFLQFCFYVGWLKVAENLMNPFGEDDDDFETNYLIDRNLRIGSMLADDLMGKPPSIQLGNVLDMGVRGPDGPVLPYTEGSIGLGDQPMIGSAADIVVNEAQARTLPVDGSQTSKSPSKHSRTNSIKLKAKKKFSNLMNRLNSRETQQLAVALPDNSDNDVMQIVLDHISEDEIAKKINKDQQIPLDNGVNNENKSNKPILRVSLKTPKKMEAATETEKFETKTENVNFRGNLDTPTPDNTFFRPFSNPKEPHKLESLKEVCEETEI